MDRLTVDNTQLNNAESRHAHRRSSSQWVPPSAPIYANPIFRTRSQRVQGSRMIQPNHMLEAARYELPNFRHFSSNAISTTKYSLISFFFMNIFHQLWTKWANLYFLFIAALNFIPMFSAFSPIIALIPPAFVIGTTMIKDGYEDIRRWKFDNEINQRTCHVWDRENQRFRKTMWKYIIVGDFVHVSNDQDIPADILLLRSSHPDGKCFIETSNLDGETSLKQRNVPRRYVHFSEDENFVPPDFSGTIFCETPDKSIYTVRAKIEYETGLFDVISKENMLLRGSKLKNTTFIEGEVMYAGHDTKVMMNNGRAPHKQSGIEKMTNWFILICVVMLFAMVISGSILAGCFVDRKETAPKEMDPEYFPANMTGPVAEGFISVGVFIICYQVLVPISLYITVEIIKVFQIYLISQDLEMYDEETDYPINCRSLNIPEELGQVSHVLSDKTGTLTENKMIFRNCAFDDSDYGGEFDPEKLDAWNPVVSPSLAIRVQDEWQDNDVMRHFFLNIVLNNSVIVNKKPHQDAIEIGTYQGGVYSIGNAAFYDITQEEFDKMVNNIKEFPTRINTRGESFASLTDIPEEDEVVITSFGPPIPQPSAVPSPDDSKAASVVISRVSSISKSFANALKKNIISPISSILPTPGSSFRMKAKSVDSEKEVFRQYEAESPDELALIQGAALYGFCLEDRGSFHVSVKLPDGTEKRYSILLTLPFDSHRKRMSVVVDTPEGPLLYTKGADSAIMDRITSSSVDADVLAEMVYTYSCRGLRTLCFSCRLLDSEEYEEFKRSYDFLGEDATQDREMMLSSKADELERDMRLLGVTGIEDRLQDGVQSTIVSLRKAGIQVWVLTGDKLETAENIARASGLFAEGMEVRTIENADDAERAVNSTHGFNLILSPTALKLAQSGDDTMIKALQRADCVLCYRMTPSEKAGIVKAVRKYLKGKVLAIGDGANDVPMIQAAHVGIGVKGKEGMQAVMACDFAIARFRFLRKLLLVHGHWSYDRLALSFLYFLYKNTNSVFILFFYQFFDGYSGSFTVDPTYAVLYPIIFTSVQPIVVGVLDQDYAANVLLKRPELYKTGIKGSSYTFPLFFLNVIDGIWQAAVMYFICHFTLWGMDAGLWTLGFYLATSMMLVNCFHLAIEVRCWTKSLAACFIFFFVFHFVYFLVYCAIAQPGMVPDPPTTVVTDAIKDSRFWYCMSIITIISLLPRFMVRVSSNSGLM